MRRDQFEESELVWLNKVTGEPPTLAPFEGANPSPPEARQSYSPPEPLLPSIGSQYFFVSRHACESPGIVGEVDSGAAF